jgi:DNA-directed RNA polymerase subunit RPC12/RpoP
VPSFTPQRSYQAACPGCGAPVDFLSAQSSHAICAYCQSLVLRQGEVLKRIGKMAELFDDHSPLQLQSAGTWNGQTFVLVGRLQYQYAEGSWTEWQALLQDGSSAWLAEDNGAYVFSLVQPQTSDLPVAEHLRLGATTAINGQSFVVAASQSVALQSAQGELAHLPPLGVPFAMVELRSQSGDSAGQAEVLSIDYGSTPPTLSRGQAVRLEDLRLSGLRAASTKEEPGRQFSCPQCGAALRLQLAATQSMTCSSCHSLIDVSQGLGGELRHASQDEPVQPLIALGSTATLQGAQWQVVGWQHRMGAAPSEPDEHFGWDEYLLFNSRRGFCFLVDSSAGWSLVKPATGAPVVSSNGQSASYLGTRYALKESYQAETNYVLGEFYWQVKRGQQTSNRDYAQGKSLLSLEQSAQELSWSVGSAIASEVVVQAFGLQDKKDLLQRRDVKPFAASGAFWLRPDFWVFVVIVLIMLSASTCSSRCDPATQDCSSNAVGTRTSGGSFGGFSTGGGHK